MASEWEEIRRLAADFQRAQFADTAQRLSERDCIEIIARLIQDKKVDVVHTIDGKEYVTPAQITREIRNELYRHGGRVNILELQQIINVNWSDVESRANNIAKSDRSVQLVLGQLIDDTYLNRLAEEVNDRLQEAGLISISELCKSYDLPGDFLNDELAKRLGKLIQGELDRSSRGVIFTPAFVARHTAKIRGLFSAITRPTPVIGMISAFGLQEHLLYSVLGELVNTGRLKGTIVGGRQDNAVYIPNIYSKTQNSWVDSFLQQNGYLEFDSLTRLGIPEPVGHIKKRFKCQNLLFLSDACVSQALVDQVEASVEEAVSSGTWTDIEAILPSCLSEDDMATLINQAMRNTNVHSAARLLGATVVVSEKWIGECLALFDDAIRQKAQKEFKSNPVLLITEEDLKQAHVLAENSGPSKKDKRDAERRKKGAEGSGTVKGGGGGNAREIRIRKTKKKGKKDDDDEETRPRSKKEEAPPFMTQEEIEAVLEDRVSDCPHQVLSELAEHLVRPLSKTYQEVLRSLIMSSTCPVSGGNKKSVKDLQEELTNLYNNIRLFEKGSKWFSDETQAVIAKHVLKSVGADVANVLVNFLAADLMMSVENPAAITGELRLKILAKVSDDTKAPLIKLHNSLNGKTIEEFLENLETAAEACGFMLKKADKKKERQAFLRHRQTLSEQLKDTEDPALVLHLTSMLLFQDSTHCILHAPGRCVPHILGTLTGRIPAEKHQLLTSYQSLVVKQLMSQSQGRTRDDEGSSDLTRCHLLTPQVKELALSQRKPSMSEANASGK
ncbi:E3 UFM1-protein ligase 1 [Hippocampus zosterae]|uniref:E3 UFM1-protein ligase 1 n=1 Tax=Hippocampus zosterae TaxID=109293 RepID=UPI00223E6051|nr:E3 UFM1-protein ligase 1 [Hippocampus zosterae]